MSGETARIAVVGGTGFIGAPTARRLAAAGHDVDVLHRARMTARFDPDVVIHFALMNERAADVPATILRLPKVYGAAARDRPFARWIDWMRAHDGGDAELPVGVRQGRWRWTHGYVEDVAAAIALAATDARAAGRTYNVGERDTPTQRQRAADLA